MKYEFSNKYSAKIYDELLSIAIEGIVEDKNLFIEGFKEYIFDSYDELFIEFKEDDGYTENELIKSMDQFIDIEKKELRDMGGAYKKAKFLKDEAYEELMDLSGEALGLAKKVYRTKNIINDDKEYNKKIEALKISIDEVKDYNLVRAKKLLSEGMMDLAFVYGKSKYTSLRLARWI
ncbi:MAG: hypothetical protein ABF289_05460 [Clostridiales bacterium]